MKRLGYVSALVSFLVCAMAGSIRADKVFTVRVSESWKCSLSAVYEEDPKTRVRKEIIPNELLTIPMKGAVDSVEPSPSGRYLLLKGMPWHSFRNRTTGRIRTAFGGSYMSRPEEEEEAGQSRGSVWIWDRESRKMTKVTYERPEGSAQATWSPGTDHILLRDSGTTSYPLVDALDRENVFNASDGTSAQYGVLLTTWSGDGKGLLLATDYGQGMRVYLQPLKGKARPVFSWPEKARYLTQTPNSSVFAIFDSRGFFLAGTDGKSAKLAITLKGDNNEAKLQFSRDGRRLAIFTSFMHGEPHVNTDYALYVVDVQKKSVMHKWLWQESFQGSGEAFSRYLDGWMPDNRTLRIGARVWYGVEKPADSQDDWVKIWTLDTTKGGGEQEIWDSGQQCMNAAWYSGK